MYNHIHCVSYFDINIKKSDGQTIQPILRIETIVVENYANYTEL